MTKPDGGPAFPRTRFVRDNDGNRYDVSHEGMSRRDYAAIHIARGLLASATEVITPENLAILAYRYADALIAEGAKDDD